MPDPIHEPGPDVARVAARCGSDTLRLEPDWPAILNWMRRFGRVVARTDNRHAFLEQPGRFGRPAILGGGRAFLGGDFALACRLDRWRTIFATIDDAGRRELRIFDAHGNAVETIEVDDPSGRPGFDEMVWRLHARDQSVEERIVAPESRPATRERALERSASRWATPVRIGFVRALFAAVAERRLEVSLAVGNAGTIHAHAGTLALFEGVSRWTAAFVSRARCSIDASSIARAWIVRVPGPAGDAHAIELFGHAGTPIVSLAGVAGADGREPLAWRRLVAGLAPV